MMKINNLIETNFEEGGIITISDGRISAKYKIEEVGEFFEAGYALVLIESNNLAPWLYGLGQHKYLNDKHDTLQDLKLDLVRGLGRIQNDNYNYTVEYDSNKPLKTGDFVEIKCRDRMYTLMVIKSCTGSTKKYFLVELGSHMNWNGHHNSLEDLKKSIQNDNYTHYPADKYKADIKEKKC